MTCRTMLGTLLLWLLAAPAVHAYQDKSEKAVPDLLTISLMRWTYDGAVGANTTTMTVCVHEAFDSSANVIFNVISNVLEKNFAGVVKANASCADFSETGNFLPLTDVTLYTVFVADDDVGIIQKGSASFAYTVTAHQLKCSEKDIVRVTVGKGSKANLETQNCPGTAGAPVSTCYVSGELYMEVCTVGLDDVTPDMQVCVTGVQPNPVEASPGLIQAESLSYADPSITINDTSVSELLTVLTNGSIFSSACKDGTCGPWDINKSDNLYELCGISEVQPNTFTSTAPAQFQDLWLAVDGTVDPIDFRLANRYSERKYLIYGTNSPNFIDDTVNHIRLDCTHIPEDAFCYGFYITDSNPTYLAVSYDDGSNTVISSAIEYPEINLN